MKKYLFLFLLMLLPGVSWAVDLVRDGDYLYSIIDSNEKTLRLAGVKSSVTEITVPATVTDNSVEYKVAAIAQKTDQDAGVDASGSTDYVAIHGNTKITAVRFAAHSNCSIISYNAFEGCTNLAWIEIPSSVTAFRRGVFSGCTNLKKVYCYSTAIANISADVLTGVEGAQLYRIGGIGSPTNANVRTTFEAAFTQRYLVNVPIAGDCIITTITGTGDENNEFTPDNYIIYNNEERKITKIGDGDACYDSNNTTMKSLVVPEGITTIGANAFKGCSTLESVVLDKVESIGNDAFSACGLKSVRLLKAKTVGDYAFNGNPLETIELAYYGSTPTIFGQHAFTGNTRPGGLETIYFGFTDGQYQAYDYGGTFNAAQAVYTPYVENWMKRAQGGGERIYRMSYNEATQEATIVDITTRSESSVTNFTPNATVPYMDKVYKVTTVGDGSNALSTAFVTIGNGSGSAGSPNLEFPTNVTKIADNAFKNNVKLTKVTLADNIENIGKAAFANCTGLTDLSAKSEIIGEEAFQNCASLATVTLNGDVKTIGKNAFAGCTSLETFSFGETGTPMKAPSAKDAFGDPTMIKAELKYPAGSTGFDKNPWYNFTTEAVYNVSFKSNGQLLSKIPAKKGQALFISESNGTVNVKVFTKAESGGTKVGNDYSFPIPAITGKEFEGWSSEETVLNDFTSFPNGYPYKGKYIVLSDGDVTLNAQFKDVKKAVKFQTQYGEDAPEDFGNTVDAAVNAEVSYPTPPAKDGYTFDKWIFKKTKDGSVVSDISNTPSGTGFLMPEYDLTAIATFKEKYYTVTYMNGDTNTLIGTKSHKKSEGVITIANEEGISFTPADGKDCTWSSSDVAVKDGKFTMIGKDVTITATSTAQSYTIKYSYEDEKGDRKNKPDATYSVGDKVSAPALTTVAGYTAEWKFYRDEEHKVEATLLKWYDDGTFQMPDYPLYAYAIYVEAKYTITFMVNGKPVGEPIDGTSYVDKIYSFKDVKPSTEVIDDKEFTGWTSSDVTIDPGVDKYSGSFKMQKKNVTIVAQYETIKYDLIYREINPVTKKEETPKTFKVAAGTTVTVEKPSLTTYTDETKGDMIFTGWTIKAEDGTIITPTKDDKFYMPAQHVTATSDATNFVEISMSGLTSHKLTLVAVKDKTESEIPSSIKLYKGQAIKDAKDVKKAIEDYMADKDNNLAGYTWALSDNTAAVSGAPVMPDYEWKVYVIFTAQKFTITYSYTKDGKTTTLTPPDTYSAGETVTPRTAPTFDGYSFSGWTSIPSQLTEDITVTGSYTKNEYILTFEVDGEVYKKTEGLTVGSAITVPAAPVKSGYIFSGWQWPDIAPMSTMPASNLTVSGYFYQSEQKVTDNESGLAFDVAVTSMNGTQGSVTLTSVPEAVLKGEKEIPSQISAGGKTYTVTKVNAAAFDNLAEGVIVYLPQTASTTADVVNVVNNGSKVKTLDLSKVKKFALPSTVASVTANEVKYTRTITGSSTVVTMPYGVAVPKGFKAYTLKGANSQKKAQFEEYTGEKLAAYTPYLLVKQSGEVAGARALLADDAAAETETTIDLSAKNVTIVPEPENAAQGDDQMSLSGTVSAISNDRGYIFGMYKLQADGSWDMTAVENDPSEYIAPFSGYLTVTNQLIEGKVEGTTAVEPEPVDPTGINAVDAAADSNASNDVWYDMRGRRLQGEPTQKGIYIKNGKKFVKN